MCEALVLGHQVSHLMRVVFDCGLTENKFLHIVQDEIQQLIIALEHAGDCDGMESAWPSSGSTENRTLPPAGKLDSDLLIDILGEIEDGLALWFLAWRRVKRTNRTPGGSSGCASGGASCWGATLGSEWIYAIKTGGRRQAYPICHDS